MNVIDKPLAAADRFQQRRTALAFPVAVWSKFTADQAGNLAALIAYYAFAAIFPLLLVLVTVLNIALKSNPSLQASLLKSALSQYPVIGTQIRNGLGSIPGTGLPLVIGIVFLLLGARGVASAMQNAMCSIWDIPKQERPGFLMSQVWAFALMFSIGIGFSATTFLSGLAGGAGHLISGPLAYIGTVLVSLVLNVGMFWLGFRLASLFRVPWRNLLTGAIIAAVVWQILQVVGGYVVGHQLQRASELYGTFGVVLGLVAWLFLQAELTLYAAEVDVVLARHLWPRSILTPSPAPAKPGKHAKPAETGQGAQPSQAEEASAVPSQRTESPESGNGELPATDKKAGRST
jgi:membrane protein